KAGQPSGGGLIPKTVSIGAGEEQSAPNLELAYRNLRDGIPGVVGDGLSGDGVDIGCVEAANRSIKAHGDRLFVFQAQPCVDRQPRSNSPVILKEPADVSVLDRITGAPRDLACGGNPEFQRS